MSRSDIRQTVAIWCIAIAAAGLLAALVASMFAGCLGPNGECLRPTIVLPERIGSPVAKAIAKVFQQEPKAISVPCGPTFFFEEATANDTCLWAHENVHRADEDMMGEIAFAAEYVREDVECLHEGHDQATCLKIIPLEAVAYEAQHLCQQGSP